MANKKPATKKEENDKVFNCVIVGTGGQGLITLLEILSAAAVKNGLDAKTSELHGLSQRGGSVEVHIKFGKQVFSPLVEAKKADLIVGLEMQECLKAAYFAGPQTQYLINKTEVMIPGKALVAPEEIVEDLQKFTKKIEVIDANGICQKELGTSVVSGIYSAVPGGVQKNDPAGTENLAGSDQGVGGAQAFGAECKDVGAGEGPQN